ncbi:MAG TPA: GNAT family protein, partial [Kribbella sp.]|nr:GNAT family protein [Kribbella sp.]
MTAVPALSDGDLTLRLLRDDPQGVAFDVQNGGPAGTVEVRRTTPGAALVVWAMDNSEAAQRALRLVSEYAFGELGLERLQVEVDVELHASARVAIRSGFRREGVLRGAALVEGERRDVAIYGMRVD